jgi:hypothetical protein
MQQSAETITAMDMDMRGEVGRWRDRWTTRSGRNEGHRDVSLNYQTVLRGVLAGRRTGLPRQRSHDRSDAPHCGVVLCDEPALRESSQWW